MHKMLPLIAAVITVILAGALYKAVSGLPFISGYTRRQKAETRKLICEYLDIANGWIYPSEIADRLNINYHLCMDVVEELLKEGAIKIKSEEGENTSGEKEE